MAEWRDKGTSNDRLNRRQRESKTRLSPAYHGYLKGPIAQVNVFSSPSGSSASDGACTQLLAESHEVERQIP